jgi:hypothetical protein
MRLSRHGRVVDIVGRQRRPASWHVSVRALTCEVTTKEPNLMTSFVSGGMAGPASSVVVRSKFCSTRSIAKCDNHDLFRWVVAQSESARCLFPMAEAESSMRLPCGRAGSSTRAAKHAAHGSGLGLSCQCHMATATRGVSLPIHSFHLRPPQHRGDASWGLCCSAVRT